MWKQSASTESKPDRSDSWFLYSRNGRYSFLEPIQEDAPFVVQPDSSSFGSPVMEIPQRTLSTVEHLETGNDDQALEEWLNNTNPDTTGIASITSSDTLVANPATNAPLDMGTPSVGAPSVTEATQPYVRAVHLEPVVFPGTESQQSHRSISGQEPALTTNGGNIEQTMSTFAIPLLSPTHSYPQTSHPAMSNFASYRRRPWRPTFQLPTAASDFSA
ncbi:hypothetical protein K2173_021733 [Erythroxylum novogranatense]|uniref:Uncharacterized protein n=1 Tax=Erythroxylum novogranatense TaxID=1862640 RepID=A0AAV8S5E5_9ROSI|nr:hypothetical protein K2173_021733 [Erythroxylum novogranatense]